MIQVGQKVRLDPLKEMKGFGAEDNRGRMLTGTVVWINVPHQWFSVRYGNNQRTSFKFCEIGHNVHICK